MISLVCISYSKMIFLSCPRSHTKHKQFKTADNEKCYTQYVVMCIIIIGETQEKNNYISSTGSHSWFF